MMSWGRKNDYLGQQKQLPIIIINAWKKMCRYPALKQSMSLGSIMTLSKLINKRTNYLRIFNETYLYFEAFMPS